MENNLKKLEQTIGYQFTAKSLLEQAMTHSSYANEKHLGKLGCNERLEFLGDAVLELISSDRPMHAELLRQQVKIWGK